MTHMLVMFGLMGFASSEVVRVEIRTQTAKATINGLTRANGVVFSGIRYAQAPIGQLRFAVSVRGREPIR
jgi:hypothetical protein